ncbi:Uncharacterised protein [Bordetella ansorpii]|uniref:Uncharacterized protein n=2 Tax=Bordetella ansorpii TaxID=288768 RepID=A0A157S4H2_9BORD|nr:Uncharacterised protein [Bordetella ansorpii]
MDRDRGRAIRPGTPRQVGKLMAAVQNAPVAAAKNTSGCDIRQMEPGARGLRRARGPPARGARLSTAASR